MCASIRLLLSQTNDPLGEVKGRKAVLDAKTNRHSMLYNALFDELLFLNAKTNAALFFFYLLEQ